MCLWLSIPVLLNTWDWVSIDSINQQEVQSLNCGNGRKKVSHWWSCIFIVITFHWVYAQHILRVAAIHSGVWSQFSNLFFCFLCSRVMAHINKACQFDLIFWLVLRHLYSISTTIINLCHYLFFVPKFPGQTQEMNITYSCTKVMIRFLP